MNKSKVVLQSTKKVVVDLVLVFGMCALVCAIFLGIPLLTYSVVSALVDIQAIAFGFTLAILMILMHFSIVLIEHLDKKKKEKSFIERT
jgi:hypothetical protein